MTKIISCLISAGYGLRGIAVTTEMGEKSTLSEELLTGVVTGVELVVGSAELEDAAPEVADAAARPDDDGGGGDVQAAKKYSSQQPVLYGRNTVKEAQGFCALAKRSRR